MGPEDDLRIANVTPPVEAVEGSMERVKEVLRAAVLQLELSKSVMGEERTTRPVA